MEACFFLNNCRIALMPDETWQMKCYIISANKDTAITLVFADIINIKLPILITKPENAYS